MEISFSFRLHGQEKKDIGGYALESDQRMRAKSLSASRSGNPAVCKENVWILLYWIDVQSILLATESRRINGCI
jgi:hypothetical protein